jgi:hypothetical protein
LIRSWERPPKNKAEANRKSKKQVLAVNRAAENVPEDALNKALAESEERFRLAFRTSPDSININRIEDGHFFARAPKL